MLDLNEGDPGFQLLTKEEIVTLIKKNSVALVRKRTMPIERPPLVGKINANFCG
jgi:hypothetical protein